MGRIKKSKQQTPNASAHWVVNEEMMINNRHVARGTELSIYGQRGRFRFYKHVLNEDKEWIDVIDKFKAFRSFRVEDVKKSSLQEQNQAP